jgi:hypothetical protein
LTPRCTGGCILFRVGQGPGAATRAFRYRPQPAPLSRSNSEVNSSGDLLRARSAGHVACSEQRPGLSGCSMVSSSPKGGSWRFIIACLCDGSHRHDNREVARVSWVGSLGRDNPPRFDLLFCGEPGPQSYNHPSATVSTPNPTSSACLSPVIHVTDKSAHSRYGLLQRVVTQAWRRKPTRYDELSARFSRVAAKHSLSFRGPTKARRCADEGSPSRLSPSAFLDQPVGHLFPLHSY